MKRKQWEERARPLLLAYQQRLDHELSQCGQDEPMAALSLSLVLRRVKDLLMEVTENDE